MKKLLSILLILVLTLSLASVTMAEDDDFEDFDDDFEEDEELEEEELEDEIQEEALDLLKEADEELSEFEFEENDLFQYALEYYEKAESAYDEGDYETALEYAKKTLDKLDYIEDEQDEKDFDDEKDYDKELKEEAAELIDEAKEEVDEFEFQDADLFSYAKEYLQTAQDAFEEGDFYKAIEYAQKTLDKLDYIEDDYEESFEFDEISFVEYEEVLEAVLEELTETQEEFESAQAEGCYVEDVEELINKAKSMKEDAMAKAAADNTEGAIDYLDDVFDLLEDAQESIYCSDEDEDEDFNEEFAEQEAYYNAVKNAIENDEGLCAVEEGAQSLTEAKEYLDKAKSAYEVENFDDAYYYIFKSELQVEYVEDLITCDDEDEEFSDDILAILAGLEQECSGCDVDGTCYESGVRFEQDGVASYCNVDGTVLTQLDVGESCQNDFECSTNSCQSGECYDLKGEIEESQGLMRKIISWFGNIFG